jgi:hypothetical protein
MLKVNAKSKVGTRRLLHFFEVSKIQHSPLVLVGAPTQGYRSPWSLQEPSAHYEMILCLFGVVDPSRSRTTIELGYQQILYGDH